ncbi:MAG: hypothetical protein KIT84_41760 [Labilithrix sp.]|nr:hypothetical protein [Labilithrix sp.]MCW5817600.1 hypothetical protein [Labilithrix sp.]
MMPLVVTPGTQNVPVTAGANVQLAPGRYASVTTKSQSVLSLSAGRYELNSLDIHSKAALAVDTTNGPVVLLVRSAVGLAGSVATSGPSGRFILGFTGTQAVNVDGPFRGSVFAPYAALSLRAHQHSAGIQGSFFAKSVKIEQHTSVQFEAFEHWSRLFGLRPILTCLSQSRVDSAAGLFGYENETMGPIELALGADNRLEGTSFSTPSTLFQPGLNPYAFYGYFDPSQGSATWSILGTSVTAESGSLRCTATDVIPVPTQTLDLTIDAPGEPSAAATARAVSNFYGPGYSTAPVPPAPFAAASMTLSTFAGPTGPRFRLRVTEVTRGDDGCGDNDPVFKSVIIGGHELGPRDMQECAEENNCDELFDAPLDLEAAEVEATFDVWDDDALLCGGDDRQFYLKLRFNAVTGANVGGSIDEFDPSESRFVDVGSRCVRTRDGDGFCWSVEVIRPTEVCFDWPADFVDSGPWSNGASEDYYAARGVQAFPASRALASVTLIADGAVRYAFDGVLDERGCIPKDRLPDPFAWGREDNLRAAFFLRPVMCADPTGAACAESTTSSLGAANIVVADSENASTPRFCTAFAERAADAPSACRTVTAAEGAFAGWPNGYGPPMLRINATDVGTKDSITPTTRVAAVVSHALERERETGGDLSVVLGLVERRYAGATPTIFANQECPSIRGTACTSGNRLYLEPDFVQRPGVFGSNRFKFVVGHELGHFFQHASQGTLAKSYGTDDINPVCACRHVPLVDGSHCIQSMETANAAQSEGYAHFLAAKLWNRDTDADCTFGYYKEFLDTTCRSGAEECGLDPEPDPGRPALSLTKPPYPISCTEKRRWRNTHCLDSTATDDKLTQGVEMDWLAFYWAINTGQAAERWPTRQIHDAYRSACGAATGEGCRQATVSWAQLRGAAFAVAETNEHARFLEDTGRETRVDDQP